MTLTCDPLDYVDAGAALSRTSEMVASARDRLLADLAPSAGIAGTDSAGEQFAASYDDTVESVFVAVRSAERASANLVELLHATGLNYARADNPQSADTSFPSVLVQMPLSAIEIAPSALGSHEGEPWGWPLLRDAVGYLWPNGDAGRLRHASDTWTLAAAGLDSAAFPVAEAVDLIAAQRTPDSPAAVEACAEFKSALHDLADCCRELGSACDGFADHLDETRAQARDLIEQFLWETALIGTISAAGTFSRPVVQR